MSLVVVHVDLLLDGLRVVKDLLAMRVIGPSRATHMCHLLSRIVIALEIRILHRLVTQVAYRALTVRSSMAQRHPLRQTFLGDCLLSQIV